MNSTRPSTTKRQALALAAVLTLAVGTGAAAVAGLAHPPSRAAAGPVVAVPVTQVPAPVREADD